MFQDYTQRASIYDININGVLFTVRRPKASGSSNDLSRDTCSFPGICIIYPAFDQLSGPEVSGHLAKNTGDGNITSHGLREIG